MDHVEGQLRRRSRRSTWRLAALALAGLLPTMAVALADAPPVHAKLEGKLVCIGDSITAGEGVKPAESYVGRLQARADAAKDHLQVVNQGRSGWTVHGYVQNGEAMVKEMPADATLVTIQLGTNDTRDKHAPEQIADQCAADMQKLIELYRAKVPNAEFVIVTPTACFPSKLSQRLRNADYNDQTPPKLAAIDKAYEALAKRLGVRFINLSKVPGTSAHSIDGVHPNAAGHAEMAEAFWRGLAGQ